MQHISAMYDYARKAMRTGTHSGAYKSAEKSLLKQVRLEKANYKKRSKENTEKLIPKKRSWIWAAAAAGAAVIIAVVCIIAFGGKGTSPVGSSTSADFSAAETIETAQVDKSEEASAESAPETHQQVSENETQQSSNIDTAEQPPEQTEEQLEEQSEEIDRSIESYNGYLLGDIVYYSGTVHYAASNSNQLSGACRGGKAMISGFSPNGIHKFHLVAADDNCTVYGWVDEVFIKSIE